MRISVSLATLAVLLGGAWSLHNSFHQASTVSHSQQDRLTHLGNTASLETSHATALASDFPALREDRQRPMYLLLTLEGLEYCPEGETQPEVVDNPTLEAFCQAHDLDNAANLQALMERLEPGGPAGKIQVGYVITTKLLSLFKADASGWVFDSDNFARQLRLIQKLDRPVALYLSSTHFDTLGPLPRQLSQDARNLALFPDLKPQALSYFTYPIFPYTLDPAPEIAVNQYKREAFARIYDLVRAMSPEDQKKIVAIFLGGETHQFFEGFEDGMGQFERPVVTDHSPAAVRGFQQWVANKYPNIEALNQAYRGAYQSFDEIALPTGNIRTDRDTPVLNHYDGYSQGTVPVHGWFWDPQDKTQAIRVYVDGQFIDNAPMGFNRLDVYRAEASIQTPSTGFRLDLPFDQLPPGKHMVSVTYVQDTYECLMDERIIEVFGQQDGRYDYRDQHRVFTSMRNAALPCPRAAKAGKRFYLDSPSNELKLGFNPLARDWNAYREQQVVDYMQAQYQWALEIGYPKDIIFSHQIVPQVNASWNQNLFATGSSIASTLPWKTGFNLYGGSVWSPWTEAFLKELAPTESSYGIPEYHPQQWKSKAAVFGSVAQHYNAGAHFISPYYFSIAPEKHLQQPESNAVSRMRLEPGNSADGSNLFYDAIVHFANQ